MPIKTIIMNSADAWDFTYSKYIDYKNPSVPQLESFSAKMPVPAYWDNNLKVFQISDFYRDVKYNPGHTPNILPAGLAFPEGSLMNISGVGWYRKCFTIPKSGNDERYTLRIGGVVMEAWVWLNGKMLKYHLGHSTDFTIELTDHIKPDEVNELIIAVANTRTDRSGCDIRAYKNVTGGIKGDIVLEKYHQCGFDDFFVYPKNNELQFSVSLKGEINKKDLVIEWKMYKNTNKEPLIKEGKFKTDSSECGWNCSNENIDLWSPDSPVLYNIKAELYDKNNRLLDAISFKTGIRTIKTDGASLKLNNGPLYLRGSTDHAYYPKTCMPPDDKNYYRDIIRKLKNLGFNWIRCHTHVPEKSFLEAADEIGIIFQVEPPKGFQKDEWLNIIKYCRNHPSVALYCCGNEEKLDEDKIKFLKEMADLCHKYSPNALFNPQEALRGIEYTWEKDELGENTVEHPFLHNPDRLSALQKFSDVFGNYAKGDLSYHSLNSENVEQINQRQEIYKHPCLSHEICIHDSYLNLDLESRYKKTRIGTELYSEARRLLEEAGLIDRANLYYQNSCRWMQNLRKQCVENTRLCNNIAGYDLLGAYDHHGHMFGFPCGIMNEFYELKYGETEEDVSNYNGESIIIINAANQRNLTGGKDFKCIVYASLFGKKNLKNGKVFWHLASETNGVINRGNFNVNDISRGKAVELGNISFKIPLSATAEKITFTIVLDGGEYNLKNKWNYWIFPDIAISQVPLQVNQEARKIFSSTINNLQEIDVQDISTLKILAFPEFEDLKKLSDTGGTAIVFNPGCFPLSPLSYQIAVCGRVIANTATILNDHPIWNGFPHEGWADWQFYSMMNKSNSMILDGFQFEFDPIFEVASSYKLVKKMTPLFECRTGKAKVIFCSLNPNCNDPGFQWFLSCMINYAISDKFSPSTVLKIDKLEESSSHSFVYNSEIYKAWDPNAQ